jgi:hypothetical protein
MAEVVVVVVVVGEDPKELGRGKTRPSVVWVKVSRCWGLTRMLRRITI